MILNFSHDILWYRESGDYKQFYFVILVETSVQGSPELKTTTVFKMLFLPRNKPTRQQIIIAAQEGFLANFENPSPFHKSSKNIFLKEANDFDQIVQKQP